MLKREQDNECKDVEEHIIMSVHKGNKELPKTKNKTKEKVKKETDNKNLSYEEIRAIYVRGSELSRDYIFKETIKKDYDLADGED